MIQFDFETAFFVSETVHMKPPQRINAKPNMVCKLNKSLYSLKQTLRS